MPSSYKRPNSLHSSDGLIDASTPLLLDKMGAEIKTSQLVEEDGRESSEAGSLGGYSQEKRPPWWSYFWVSQVMWRIVIHPWIREEHID